MDIGGPSRIKVEEEWSENTTEESSRVVKESDEMEIDRPTETRKSDNM